MTFPELLIGNVPVSFPTLQQATEAIIGGTAGRGVHLCNAYTIALADEDPHVAASLTESALNLPDGMPLVWFAQRRQVPSPERVYGPDLMAQVLDHGRQHGTRHYFYGSTPEVLTKLTGVIESTWPGAEIVGVESPPFRDLTDEELRESVNKAGELGADIVWVGMGTPKQDVLVHKMAAMGPATFVAIGAAFDFLAGTKPQAPSWMQKLGLEWLFRLLSEPRRLSRRYLVYNWRFLRVLKRRSSIVLPRNPGLPQ